MENDLSNYENKGLELKNLYFLHMAITVLPVVSKNVMAKLLYS